MYTAFPYCIRPILQNSKLCREKFVKSKKMFNENKIITIERNFNLIFKRKLNTYENPEYIFYNFGGDGDGDGPNWKKWLYMFLVTYGVCMTSNHNEKNNKKN